MQYSSNKSDLFLLIFKKTVTIIGLGLILALTVFLIWSSFLGFDFTDESLYSVGYYFELDIDFTFSFFHRIYNSIFGLFKFNLYQNRILGVLLILITSIVLANTISVFLGLKNRKEIIIIASVLGFLGYTLFPMSVSYNLLSVIFIAFFIAISVSKIKPVPKSILLGFLSAFIVLNKFTNLLFIVVYVLFYIFMLKKKITLKSLIYMVIGGVFAVFFLFHNISSMFNGFKSFKIGLGLAGGHSFMDMITRLYDDLFRLTLTLKHILPILVIIGLLKIKLINKKIKIELVLVISFILNYSYLLYIYNGFVAKADLPVFYFLYCITLIVIVLVNKKYAFKNKLFFIGLFFLLIPFIAVAGTNNSFFMQFLLYGNILAIGYFLLLEQLAYKKLKYLMFLTLISVSAFHIYSFRYDNPYRLHASLTTQTKEVKGVKYLSKIKVDSASLSIINNIKELNNHPSKYIFTLSHQIGLSLLTNKKPLIFAWINLSNYKSIPVFLANKENVLEENILFFLPSDTLKRKKVIEYLSESKTLNFRNNYKYWKTIESKEDSLYIYELKNN